MDTNVWWIGPTVLVVLRLLLIEANAAQASRRGDSLVFRGTAGLRLVLLVGIVGLLTAMLVSGRDEEMWVLLLGCGFIVAMCFGWPATITIGGDAIRQRVWWKPTRIIHWKDVTAIDKRASGEIEVYAKDGWSILFSRFHVDPSRFEQEVLRRAGLKRPLDGSSISSMRNSS